MSTFISENFERVNQINEAQLEDLYHLYQQMWWSKRREKVGIRRMVDRSDLIVGLRVPNDGKLVAFSRILTDYVYRATIWDVVVENSYQGRGLGRKLIESILDHPDLQEVEMFLLICMPEKISFYEKFGFTAEVGGLQLMAYTRSQL